MIKILLISPNVTLPGGVNTYSKLLRHYLEQEKFDVKPLFVGKSGLGWIDLFYPLLILKQVINLKKNLRDFRPDLIHINPSLTYTALLRDFIFLKIIKKDGYPVVFFIHGWRENVSEKFQHKLLRNYFKKRFEIADTIVVLANQFKEKLLELGIHSDKIFVSSTMVDTAQYPKVDKNFSQPYNILFCSHMVRQKGPYELLDAVPIVVEKYPHTSFIFLGDGKELHSLKTKTKEMGIEKNVQFPGYTTGNDKIEFFKQAHIFVSPSHSEGFPTVVLEAMAAGLPLVITPVGGLVDAITEGKHGFFITAKTPDPKEITEKIIQLLEHPNVMKSMSRNNMNEAKEKYDVSIVSMKIIEIYTNILKRKN